MHSYGCPANSELVVKAAGDTHARLISIILSGRKEGTKICTCSHSVLSFSLMLPFIERDLKCFRKFHKRVCEREDGRCVCMCVCVCVCWLVCVHGQTDRQTEQGPFFVMRDSCLSVCLEYAIKQCVPRVSQSVR